MMPDDQSDELQGRTRRGTRAASRRLARMLVEHDAMAQDELLDIQEQHPDEYLGDVLIREGILLESYLQGLFIRALHIPWLAVDRCEVCHEAAVLLPKDLCRDLRIVPISRARDFLTIACINPLNEEALNQAHEITGLKVRSVLCSQDQFLTYLKMVYGAEQSEDSDEEEEAAIASATGNG